MKNNQDLANNFRSSVIIKRLSAYACVLLVLFQSVIVSAGTLTNTVIQDDLSSNPLFQLVPENYDFQYVAHEYAEQADPIVAQSIDTFYQDLKSNHRTALGEPTYVPIGVSGITTIIPLYKKPKLVGTPFVQNRYVRQQIYALLGRNLVNADEPEYADETTSVKYSLQQCPRLHPVLCNGCSLWG